MSCLQRTIPPAKCMIYLGTGHGQIVVNTVQGLPSPDLQWRHPATRLNHRPILASGSITRPWGAHQGDVSHQTGVKGLSCQNTRQQAHTNFRITLIDGPRRANPCDPRRE